MIERKTTGSFFTNSYIISNEKKECVIVDPGLGYKEAANYIKENYTPVAILITHAHIDHIDGIQYFMNLPIYIHTDDAKSLYDTDNALYPMLGRVCPFSDGDLYIKEVNDGDVISLIGYEFKVIHTPGHTRGSCCYLYKDKLLSGDTLFRMSCGRTDFPTGSPSNMRLSLNKLANIIPDNTNVHPGHDEKTTMKDEKKYNPYLKY